MISKYDKLDGQLQNISFEYLHILFFLDYNKCALMNQWKTSCRAWLKLCKERIKKWVIRTINKPWKSSWLRNKKCLLWIKWLRIWWKEMNNKFKMMTLTNWSMTWLNKKSQEKTRKYNRIWTWINTKINWVTFDYNCNY